MLRPDGRVNRKAVAEIIFRDATQRQRLEALVHPLLRAGRAGLRERAKGAKAVVIDAPLLFEAGVDAECDTVIYVDSPREQRLARVRATRGWDEPELERREASQLPLEQKRRRSAHLADACSRQPIASSSLSVIMIKSIVGLWIRECIK